MRDFLLETDQKNSTKLGQKLNLEEDETLLLQLESISLQNTLSLKKKKVVISENYIFSM